MFKHPAKTNLCPYHRMASAEIHKEKVFDARILQPEQRFAVVQGGANNTAAPYNAIASTTSQHSFNIGC